MSKTFAELGFLQEIADEDVAKLVEKGKSYGNSWKKRGGVGAFMMLARKWDRIHFALEPAQSGNPTASLGESLGIPVPAWDIFTAAELDNRSEGILDDIQDLRRYLLLIEAELKARANDKTVCSNTTHFRATEQLGASISSVSAKLDGREESGH